MKIGKKITDIIRYRKMASNLRQQTTSMWLKDNSNIAGCCWTTIHINRTHTDGTTQTSTKERSLISWALAIATGGCGLAYFLVYLKPQLKLSAVTSYDDKKEIEPGSEVAGLPVYTYEQVSKHDSLDKGVWVSFKSGVYDITNFIPKHPGGSVILMAAGGSLEPFWEIYATHKSDEVFKLMEDCRIGNLHETDRNGQNDNTGDPYGSEPKRHPALVAASLKPFNAEPPLRLLVDSFLTPNALFYVRNHLPVPVVNADDYELEVSGHGVDTATLTLKDIKTRFPKVTVTTTVQCAGNRRSELNGVKEVKGLNWGAAAIGTAEWKGARLTDVLSYLGANLNDPRIKHVQFEGLDLDPAGVPYGASVPADKALDAKCDVILAYEMNGEEVPRDHGFPLRVVVPGVVGARSVKWLARIVLSDEESHSHWQRNDYKGFSPSVEWGELDYTSSPAIQELPVTSAICDPSPGSIPKMDADGRVEIRGYAWSGGGRKIVRVDVSADEGRTWSTADLQQEAGIWSWTLWQAKVPLPKGVCSGQEVEVMCKAVDSSYNVQPDTFPPIWNVRGVLANAWHRVRVKIP